MYFETITHLFRNDHAPFSEGYRNIPVGIAAKIQNNISLYVISRQTRRVKLYFRVKMLSFKHVLVQFSPYFPIRRLSRLTFDGVNIYRPQKKI